MLSALPLAISDLGDRRVQRVLVKSLTLTVLIFFAVAALLGWLLTGTNPCGIGPLDLDCTVGAEGGTLASILIALAGIWLLFPPVAIGVLNIFGDDIVAAVEARHYPAAAAAAQPFSFGASAWMGIKSAGRLLLWNLLAVPFYLILLFTAVGPFLLFAAVNALALGRDLGEMVAARHRRGADLHAWVRASRGRRAALGLTAAILFLIPFVHLIAPILSASLATHLFHRETK